MNLGSSSGSYPCIMFLLICQLLKLMTSSSFCSLKEVGAQKYLLLVSSFYGPRIIVIAKLILSDLHQVSKNWSTAICKTTLHGESVYICVCIYMCVCIYTCIYFFGSTGSSLLQTGFFWLQWGWRATLRCSIQASYCSDISCFETGAWLLGIIDFVALPHVGSSWTRDGALHWHEGSLPLDHQGGTQHRSVFECFPQKMRILMAFFKFSG